MARGLNGPKGQALAFLAGALAAGWGTADAADAPDAYWNAPWIQVSGGEPELAGAVNNGLRRANETYFYGERATKMLATIRGDEVDLKIVDQATGEVLAERRGLALGDSGSGVAETITAGALAWMDTLSCGGDCAAAGGGAPAETRVAAAPAAAETKAEPVKAPAAAIEAPVERKAPEIREEAPKLAETAPATPEPARDIRIRASEEATAAVPRADAEPSAPEVALAPVEAPKTDTLAVAAAPATDDAPETVPAGSAPDLALANVPLPRARVRLEEPVAASVGKLAGMSLEGITPSAGAPDAAPAPAIANLPAATAPEPAGEPVRIAALPEKGADLPAPTERSRESEAPVLRIEKAPPVAIREPETVEPPVARAEPEVVETPIVRDTPAAAETTVLRIEPVVAVAPVTPAEPADAPVAPAEPEKATSDAEAPVDAEPLVAAVAPADTLRDVTPGVALPLPRPDQDLTVSGAAEAAPVVRGSTDAAAPVTPAVPESPRAVTTEAETPPDTRVAVADPAADAPTFEPNEVESDKDARLAAELDANLPERGGTEVAAIAPEAPKVPEAPLKAPETAAEVAPADATDATPPADKVETRVAAVDPTAGGPTLANARWIGFTPAVFTGSDDRAGAWISGPFDRQERTGWITDTATGATTRVTFVWRAADGGNRTAQLSREAAKALGLSQGDVANVAVYLPR